MEGSLPLHAVLELQPVLIYCTYTGVVCTCSFTLLHCQDASFVVFFCRVSTAKPGCHCVLHIARDFMLR
jgi:hypothetical protein